MSPFVILVLLAAGPGPDAESSGPSDGANARREDTGPVLGDVRESEHEHPQVRSLERERPELGLEPVREERKRAVAARRARTRPARRTPKTALGRYLSRRLPPSARHLDHGVIEVAAAAGLPDRYRLSLGLGLLDHLSLGASVHWLEGQPRPQFAPWGSVAFVRKSWFELGAHYRYVLYPPPPTDEAREEHPHQAQLPAFQRRSHYVLGAMSFSHSLLSIGFDVGIVHWRRPKTDDFEASPAQFVRETDLAGGFHARVGTRRWGARAEIAFPAVAASLRFDVRFSGFEIRQRGGWRPH